MQITYLTFQNYATSTKNLEFQIGQIANLISERYVGTLPKTNMVNPKEQVNAISLSSGREIRWQPKEPMVEPQRDTKDQATAKSSINH